MKGRSGIHAVSERRLDHLTHVIVILATNLQVEAALPDVTGTDTSLRRPYFTSPAAMSKGRRATKTEASR